MSSILFIAALIPFYILGSFPTGLFLARLKGIDITSAGSGNIGATNVTRVVGVKSGVTTLLVDVLKGFLAVFIASLINDTDHSYSAGAGIAVVLGHCFSLPGIWRGGKGVATALGVLIAIDPVTAVLALIVFASLLAWKSIVSLASVTAVAFAPVSSALRSVNDQRLFALAVVAAVVIARHHANLHRLVLGTEGKFELKKKPSRPTA